MGNDCTMVAEIDALTADETGGVKSSGPKLRRRASESMSDAPVCGVDGPGAGGGGGGRGSSEADVSPPDNLSMSLLFQTSGHKMN